MRDSSAVERGGELRSRNRAVPNEPIAVLRLGSGKRGNHPCSNEHRDRLEVKDFSNVSFPPETLGIMKVALDAAVASLPYPVSSVHVQSIAETILRTAKEGERDPTALQRLALLELQISTRDWTVARTARRNPMRR